MSPGDIEDSMEAETSRMRGRPKFSILIPVKNGMPFLEHTVRTVLEQDYEDYELIVSVDASTDYSLEAIQEFQSRKLHVVQPTRNDLSPTDHWEFLSRQARGDWQMFLGQDDGVQPYFFKLAKALTDQAMDAGVRTICAQRAHFWWADAESTLPSEFWFRGNQTTALRTFKLRRWLATMNIDSYHNLPQMYTNSIFSRTLLDDIRSRFDGNLFFAHPEDASLAAAASLVEDRYLWSNLPLGWVGTSASSHGRAVMQLSNQTPEKDSKTATGIAEKVAALIASSPINYPDFAGHFNLGDKGVYFHQAQLQFFRVQGIRPPRPLSNRFLRTIIFSIGMARYKDNLEVTGLHLYEEVCEVNKISFRVVLCLSKAIKFIARPIKSLMRLRLKFRFNRSTTLSVFGAAMTPLAAGDLVLARYELKPFA